MKWSMLGVERLESRETPSAVVVENPVVPVLPTMPSGPLVKYTPPFWERMFILAQIAGSVK